MILSRTFCGCSLKNFSKVIFIGDDFSNFYVTKVIYKLLLSKSLQTYFIERLMFNVHTKQYIIKVGK